MKARTEKPKTKNAARWLAVVTAPQIVAVGSPGVKITGDVSDAFISESHSGFSVAPGIKGWRFGFFERGVNPGGECTVIWIGKMTRRGRRKELVRFIGRWNVFSESLVEVLEDNTSLDKCVLLMARDLFGYFRASCELARIHVLYHHHNAVLF